MCERAGVSGVCAAGATGSDEYVCWVDLVWKDIGPAPGNVRPLVSGRINDIVRYECSVYCSDVSDVQGHVGARVERGGDE